MDDTTGDKDMSTDKASVDFDHNDYGMLPHRAQERDPLCVGGGSSMTKQKVERGWKVVHLIGGSDHRYGGSSFGSAFHRAFESAFHCGFESAFHRAFESAVHRDFESAFRRGSTVRYGCFWTQPIPGSGPLCVFKREFDARQWAAAYQERALLIVPCWYVPSAQRRVWSMPVSESYGRPVFQPVSLPSGTVLADAVFLDLP
jgi:hypothetical protein